jgi:DNA-binding transcriptional LysR family regulator
MSYLKHGLWIGSGLFTFCWLCSKSSFVLDIRKLNMLVELDRLGTISAVAKSLNLTAPGISMQLAGLERELGVQLTERRGRRIVVTPAGHLLAQHGSGIVDMLAVAEMELASLKDGVAGTYRVAAFPSAARSIMPIAWRALVDTEGATIQLRLVEMEPSDALSALNSGEVEVVVAHSYSNMPPVTGPGLAITQIASERVLLAVHESQWSGDSSTPVRLGDFAGHDWIVPGREWTCFDMVHRATDLAGFAPQTVAEATDFQVQLALVAQGIGVALIPELGATNVPVGVLLLELQNPVRRNVIVVTRRASAGDSGLIRVHKAIADAASERLPAG